MKKQLSLFLFFAVPLLFFGQSPLPILKTADADLKKDDVFIGMITQPDSSVILISTGDDQKFLAQRFDRNLVWQKSTISYLPGYTNAKNFNSLIQLKDKYFLCFSRMDRSDYWYSYYIVEFDPLSMHFNGSTRTIISKEEMARGTVNNVPNMHFGYRNYTNTVNCYYKDITAHMPSPDSSKYLFAFSRPDSASLRGNKLHRYKELEVVSDTEKVSFNIFDANFKLIWKREFTFKNKLKVEDYALSNDGKVYVLAKLDSAAKRKFDSNYEIYVIDSISKPDTLCPNFNGRSMKNGKFFSLNSKDLWIAGSFTDRYFENGAYITSIYDTLPHYDERRGDVAKMNVGKNDLYLRQILKTGNGKFKIIFEEYSQKLWGSNKEYNERSSHALINEHFEDLHVVSVNNTGNIEWIADIPKLQVDIKAAAATFTNLPFKTVATYDAVRIFYIDSKKNFEQTPSTWKTDSELGRFARMAGVYVSPSGNVRKYEIGKIDDLGTLVGHYYFSNAYMYTAKEQNKKNQLFKLKME